MRNTLSTLKIPLLSGILTIPLFAPAQSSPPPSNPASTNPTFDVVSIRQVDPTQMINTPRGPLLARALVKPCEYLRDRVKCQLPLRRLIQEAFQLQEYEIPGPDWLDSGSYVVQATMPLDTNKDTARLMLQRALEDRFSLKFHRELRVVPVYEMVPGKHGIKLQPAGDPAHRQPMDIPSLGLKGTASMSPGQFFAMAITPERLAIYLREIGEVDRPIVNRTGLSGEYRIDMHWEPPEDQNSRDSGKDPAFRYAVESQLGIHLNKTTAPINMFIIDHVDRTPSAN
jgi:uncharacterized protein (TIGR03435 family)